MKNYFTRTSTIPANLGKFNLQQLMNFPTRKEALLEDFYLEKVFSDDHIQISIIAGRRYDVGIHDFKYNSAKNEIILFSKYKRSAFGIYLAPALLLIPLINISSFTNQEMITYLITLLFAFIGFTLLMKIGINNQSKEIERELVLRINYLYRNKKLI